MTLEQEVIHWKNMVKMYKFDLLTGLKQRQDFEVETMHKMTNQRFHLAMFDVTGLHKANREKGYSAGDALIRQVASDIRRMDGLWELYRIGGDEFVALFFDEPEVDTIANATGASVYSCDYETLHDMLTDVDKLVTGKKAALGRRRSD